jgi:hypothetical protein
MEIGPILMDLEILDEGLLPGIRVLVHGPMAITKMLPKNRVCPIGNSSTRQGCSSYSVELTNDVEAMG